MKLLLGDCLQLLSTIPDASVDAVVTDPPYGLSFMGKAWDYDVPTVDVWRHCLRVLKPGGHLLAFAGTRTQHRMAVAIEDAGFEIRDMIAWVYGSGFPKSLDVSKAIDKAAGAEPEVVGVKPGHEQFANRATSGHLQSDDDLGAHRFSMGADAQHRYHLQTAPATAEAHQWSGWGTALKPALEPITVARKPLAGTVAENVLRHGTGAINVNGCRVAHGEECRMMAPSKANILNPSEKCRQAGRRDAVLELKPEGRWPANLIHDGSDGPCNLLAEAARFFYTAKASKSDRDDSNTHPTVKPTDLMRYLCRLVTPPSGVVLDPFMGSGSTGKAALLEGFDFIGIERDPDYFAIADQRVSQAMRSGYQPSLL